MIRTIADFAPEHEEVGVGLALQDGEGRYMFMLAGSRYRCPAGELLYAGIGGHREEGENWTMCARREASEEIGTDVEVFSAPITWYIPQRAPIQQLEVVDLPRPLAFYEWIHPPGTRRAGELYRLVIYNARVVDALGSFPAEELCGVILLTAEQVMRGPTRKPTLAELIDEGAFLITGSESINQCIRLYPVGTAMALAHVLTHTFTIRP